MYRTVFAHSRNHSLAAILFGALTVTVMSLFPGAAQAAPQSLGLVTTAQPVPMICSADGCVAQLSSFCLQRDRKSPNYRTPYYVAGGEGLWLHLTDADGGQRKMPAEGLARLVSTRGYTAVEAHISAVDLAALGAREISVEVGKLVTLFPETDANDPDPITAAEAAEVQGPIRQFAADIFESADGLGEAINILDRSINSIPEFTRLGDEERRGLWARVAGAPPGSELGDGARRAGLVFDACLDDLERQVVFGLRTCLQGRRDLELIRANQDYWAGLETGS
jgi:hypothetical protein